MTGQLVVRDFTDAEDLYNYSMGHLAHRWPEARVRYRYINRDRAHRFRAGFARDLWAQIEALAELRLSDASFRFFRATLPWLPESYVEWLRGYRFDPAQVELGEESGRLSLEIAGRWHETIYWEIKLLAMISELAQRDAASGEPRRLPEGWESHIHRKAERLSEAGVQWIDFGTRRRYSFEVQDAVVRIMKNYGGFRGTSNPFLARQHGVKAIGTYAHQLPMAMQVLYGVRDADRMAMEHWVEAYGDDLGIALSDTLTTENFLRSFDRSYASRFGGVRQDSGDPFAFGERLIRHYESLGIDPATKVIVFSDNLHTDLAVRLHEHFAGRIRTTMGIGTHLTADPAMTGVPPLNHVIKLVEADFGSGARPVVKLSDDVGKVLGDAALVAAVRTQLGQRHGAAVAAVARSAGELEEGT
jgi:nicotinate phosphoribosyltransferase